MTEPAHFCWHRSERCVNGLCDRARVVGMAVAGVAPRVMGIGPAPATRKLLDLTGLGLAQIDVSGLPAGGRYEFALSDGLNARTITAPR